MLDGGIGEHIQERGGLVEALLIFGREFGIHHDAATGPAVQSLLLKQQRPDRDVGIHLTVMGQITDGTAINAATGRLQLFDDLHRAQLGRAGDRAAGKTAAQDLQRIDPSTQLTAHTADQMMDARIGLDGAQLRHPHAAGSAALAKIVAQQIDDHDVLRAVFLARGQLGCERAIASRVLRARPRTLDRARLDRAVAHGDETFWRRAQQRGLGETHEGRKRRRVEAPQAQIGIEGIARRARRETLREIDLITIAVGEIALDARERGRVVGHTQLGRYLRIDHEARRQDRRCQGPRYVEQRERGRDFAAGQAAVHEPRALLEMINHQRAIVEAHRHFRQINIARGAHRQTLPASREIVAEGTDGTAAERQVLAFTGWA